MSDFAGKWNAYFQFWDDLKNKITENVFVLFIFGVVGSMAPTNLEWAFPPCCFCRDFEKVKLRRFCFFFFFFGKWKTRANKIALMTEAFLLDY
jgi:hypothetical protein